MLNNTNTNTNNDLQVFVHPDAEKIKKKKEIVQDGITKLQHSIDFNF